jgi:hypothetical protein
MTAVAGEMTARIGATTAAAARMVLKMERLAGRGKRSE